MIPQDQAVAVAQESRDWLGESPECECRMSITKDRKSELIQDYRRTDADTGSPDVQVAVLTARINELTEHLKTHGKDHSSRRGLLMMVSRRRRLLNYVRRHDAGRYMDLITRLKIRK
jgi:small subunit ribosomal protein S15